MAMPTAGGVIAVRYFSETTKRPPVPQGHFIALLDRFCLCRQPGVLKKGRKIYRCNILFE